MVKYRKKPVIIDAVRYVGEENTSECMLFCDVMEYDHGLGEFTIQTLEGLMIMNKGDYIIKGIAGEFYPCKPEIFEESYELVLDKHSGREVVKKQRGMR